MGFKDGEAFTTALQQSLESNPVKVTRDLFGNSSTDFDEEEIKSALDDSGMSEAGFGRMSQAMYEDQSGYFQAELSRLPEEIEDAQSALDVLGERTEENAEEFDEASNKVKNLTDEFEDLKDESKDTAAANVRLNKGVSKLVNS